MVKADFALQWLDFLGVRVYNKGKRIFKYEGLPDYEISPLDTKLKVGQELGDEDDEKRYVILSFLDLENFGYTVKKLQPNEYRKWRHAQRAAYVIVVKTRNTFGISYDSFRKSGMKIEHDPANKRVRLLGEFVLASKTLRRDAGMGEWVSYDKKKDPLNNHQNTLNKSGFDIRTMMRSSRFDEDDDEENDFAEIKEIPIMISDENSVICIPRKEEGHRIIIAGATGYGKSVFTNGVSGRLFYAGDRVGWLLDPMNQFYDMGMPQDHNPFIKTNMLLNQPPKPLPVVNLYMSCKYEYDIVNPNISLVLTQNFEEFLKKYKFYTYGIKDYDVGATIRYLPDYIKDIKNVQKADEIKDVMMDKVPNAHKDKGAQAMIYKWVNTFETIFKENFLSNPHKEDDTATDELEIRFPDGEMKKGHPWIMLTEAGVIPILNIEKARRERWLRNYLADLMQKIIANQASKRKEDQKTIYVIADEMGEIYEKGKKKDNASAAFIELYRQGRFNKTGFFGNTQSLEKIEEDLYKNSSYICCFFIKTAKERKKLEDFQVEKEVYEQLGNLKEMEMMIFKNPKDVFIVYDKYGRRTVEKDRKWFRGKILPPVNHHKKG